MKRGVQVAFQRFAELRLIALIGFAARFPFAAESQGAAFELAVGVGGVGKGIFRIHQRVAVVRKQAEEAVLHGGMPFLFQLFEGQKAARRLAHLAARRVQVQHVEPVAAPFVAEVRLALGDLVGVVGEYVVDAAAVDIDVFAQIFHGDARAFDVPAGVAYPPGAVPFQGLVFKFRLGEPQHEVVLVALVLVFVYPFAHAHFQVFFLKVEELVVLRHLRGIEVHVAARLIGVALVHQRLDDADELVHAPGGGLHHVRPLDVQLFAVGKKCVGVKGSQLAHRLVLAPGAQKHLVFAAVGVVGKVPDVGDVHHPRHVIAQIAQRLFQHVFHQVGAQVADVCKVIHGGAAGVHLHLALLPGDKFLHLPCQRVVKFHTVLRSLFFLI